MKLPSVIVIENVIQFKMRGKVVYQSQVPSSIALQLTYVKPFDLKDGTGYQRPADPKRINDFALYLSKGEDALFTPILLNAGGHWEFVSYEKNRPSIGRLLCHSKGSLMDGQHRLGGVERYSRETNAQLTVPFMAFHFLDPLEEVTLFDTINTKAKGISSSLSRYLKRESDEMSWIATALLTSQDSPFYHIGSIIGKRSKGRHVTLQNLYRILSYLLKSPDLLSLSKEEKLRLVQSYFNFIREQHPNEWINYKDYKLTHIVCLDALALTGAKLIPIIIDEHRKLFDSVSLSKMVKRLGIIDWSIEGPFKYLKGINGAKTLAVDLYDLMLPDL